MIFIFKPFQYTVFPSWVRVGPTLDDSAHFPPHQLVSVWSGELPQGFTVVTPINYISPVSFTNLPPLPQPYRAGGAGYGQQSPQNNAMMDQRWSPVMALQHSTTYSAGMHQSSQGFHQPNYRHLSYPQGFHQSIDALNPPAQDLNATYTNSIVMTPSSPSHHNHLISDGVTHHHPGKSHLSQPTNTTAPLIGAKEPFSWPRALKGLGITAAAVGTGYALKRAFPNQGLSNSFLPTDWKVYAQIGLGVLGVKSLNEGLGIEPPAWLNAVETTALIHPMALGFNAKAFKSLPLLSAYVAGLVTASQWAAKQFDDKIGQPNGIPSWIPKIGISVATALAGAKAYPFLTRELSKTGLLGKSMQQEALSGKTFASTTAGGLVGATCMNGCCPSTICAVEVGDALSSMVSSQISPTISRKKDAS